NPNPPSPTQTPPSLAPFVGCVRLVQQAKGVPLGTNPFSSEPVRYFDGTVNLTSTDLISDGFGAPWGQTRSWSNTVGYAATDLNGRPLGYNGNGWVSSLPFLLADKNFSTAIVVLSGTDALFFDDVNGRPTPRFFVQDQLLHPNGEFI